MAAGEYTLSELCIVAAAEAWRGNGEILASGIGVIPRLAAGLAKLTFSPGLLMTDGECVLVSEPVPVGSHHDYRPKSEGWLPFRQIFDLLWAGKRHAMMSPVQIDRYGCTNISLIGDPAKPKVQLLGVRGIPGNTINHPCSFFVPDHSLRSFVERVDMASGCGYDPVRWTEGVRRAFVDLRLVVSNIAVLDFGGPCCTMRLRSVHPGITVEQVRQATGFELTVGDDVVETPTPTDEQLSLIREVLDPYDVRQTAVKER